MPRYDFRCRTCDTVYEERRQMDDADAAATCPAGHVGAVRLLPIFATVTATSAVGVGVGGVGGGGMPVAGGCGGGCACYAG